MSYVPPHMREDDADNDIDAASMTNSPTMAIPDSAHDHATVPDGAAAGEPAPGQKIVSTTCVYVEYLPLDVTVEEVAREFARCGELELDAQDKPRIKLYRYRDGGLKGDGLVNYKDAEGAAQAIENMDGRPLRMYSDDDDGDAMIVTMAFFETKEKKQKPAYAESDYKSSQQRNKDTKSWGSTKDNNGKGAFGGNGGSKRYTGDDEPSMAAPAKSTKGGKPKQTVDEDGWETIVSTKPAAQTPAPVAEQPKAVASPPREPSDKPKVKQSLSVMTSSGSLVAAWGDDSTDEESDEEEAQEGPTVIEDIEGIDDMTGDVTNDSDSEDEEVKEQRKQDAIAAKEQAAISGGKSKAKKANSKQSYSKKEMKELKAKEDEEFERMLTQAVAEVNLFPPAKAEQSSNVSSTTSTASDAESATPPPEPAVLDKAAAAKAAKNKKRKEMAKRKKEEEAAAKTKAAAKVKTEDAAKVKTEDAGAAGASSAASATTKEPATKPQMSPAEVLALKKEKRARREAKAAKEKAELNAKKMAIQKKAKEQRAKTVANYDQTKREKFHFSSENSSGCDAG